MWETVPIAGQPEEVGALAAALAPLTVPAPSVFTRTYPAEGWDHEDVRRHQPLFAPGRRRGG